MDIFKFRFVITGIFVTIFFANLSYSIDQQKIDYITKLINSAEYDKAIEVLNADRADTEILLSIAYLGKGELDTAKKFALVYLTKNPLDVVVNYILAFISEEEKDYVSAMRYWEVVLQNSKDKSVKSLAKKHIEVIKKITK